MTTLDQVAKEFVSSKTTLLKLDLQGYELEALKGAAEVLKQTEMVIMEVSFLSFNQGAALFHEAVKFMENRGFLVYDVGSQGRWNKDGSLVQADVFFVKKDSRLRQVDFKQTEKEAFKR